MTQNVNVNKLQTIEYDLKYEVTDADSKLRSYLYGAVLSRDV